MLSGDRKDEIRRPAEHSVDNSDHLTSPPLEELVHELMRGREDLQRSRREFETLFQSAPIGYFVLDKEGGIVDVNLYGANLLQADRTFLYRKPFIVFIPREHQSQFVLHLQRVFDEARLQSHEMPIMDRRGRRLWARFESRLQVTEDGTPRCFMAVIDVTDRKQVEDDLILAREDAIQASRAKNLFLANMSHEIRTPMNAVLAMSELTMETELDDEQREWVSVIQSSARDLTRIIDDVLDFSRIEANKLKIENAPFSLPEVLATTVGLFGPQAMEKRIELRLEEPDDLHPWYMGDQHRIRQVLYNLLSNAVKFTDQGEIVLCVRSQIVSEYLYEITFEVRDTGIGIRDSLRERIFESFQQGDISYSKAYQGTGLGLSISRRLAKLMSGQLYFTSTAGQGSTFYFTIPLHLDSGPPPTAPSVRTEPAKPAATDRQTGSRRILVAEDNGVNVVVVRTVLERAGYGVATAATGGEVVERLAEERYDLVLMDISMPEIDGLEATRRVRAGEIAGTPRDVPIVAITAHSMQGDREQFLAAGMSDYLAKPFSRQRLLDVVARALREPGDDIDTNSGIIGSQDG